MNELISSINPEDEQKVLGLRENLPEELEPEGSDFIVPPPEIIHQHSPNEGVPSDEEVKRLMEENPRIAAAIKNRLKGLPRLRQIRYEIKMARDVLAHGTVPYSDERDFRRGLSITINNLHAEKEQIVSKIRDEVVLAYYQQGGVPDGAISPAPAEGTDQQPGRQISLPPESEPKSSEEGE